MTKLQNIRNIGTLAHVDSGKTSLTERMLFYTGRIHRIGEVHDGAATMDSMKQERDRGITITSAATSMPWQGLEINLIDTPGHIDFSSSVEQSIRVLDGAILLLDSVAGVQPQTETVWRQIQRHNVPAIAFINKMDRMGADAAKARLSIETKLGAKTVPINLPLIRNEVVVGVLDLVWGEAWLYPDEGLVPTLTTLTADELSQLANGRAVMYEALAEEDEEFLGLYLDSVDHGNLISQDQIMAAIKRTCQSRALVPVLHGSALKNIGVQPVLDAVVNYLPAPKDLGDELLAFVFKVQAAGIAGGRTTWTRMYSGTLKAGDTVFNSRTQKSERIARIVRLHADKVEKVDQANPGDIVSLIGLRDAKTGDTLGNKGVESLHGIQIPEPTVTIAAEARDRQAQDKLTTWLPLLAIEDPSFRYRTDEHTGQLLLAGVGELHLEVILSRLKEEAGIELNTGAPQVTYRHRPSQTALNVVARVKRQTGGRGAFAHVVIDMLPGVAGSGLVFENRVVGGSISREYIPAIEAGVRERAVNGVDGEEIVDCIVRVMDGSMHAVDSSEFAFKEAGSLAFELAMQASDLERLEPVANVEVIAPDTDFGTVAGDLQKRRGIIIANEIESNEARITARVPLAEMFGYTNSLRSATQGRGVATVTPAGYEVAPKVLA